MFGINKYWIKKLLQFLLYRGLPVILGMCYVVMPKEAIAEELSYIQEYMQFLSDRDMVLSKNIANADTPHYKPKDLSQQRSDTPSFSLELTNPMHISYESGVRYDLKDGEVLEIKPNGNEVHLEHEMMQKNENALKMQESANLYSKARNLMKIAVTGSPK